MKKGTSTITLQTESNICNIWGYVKQTNMEKSLIRNKEIQS